MKLTKILIVTLATFLCIGSIIYAFNAADNVWSVGTAANGIELTVGGALVPGTDNDIDLGTSSLQFKNLYIKNVKIDSFLNLDEVFQTIVSSVTTTVTPTSSFMILTSTGSNQSTLNTIWRPAPGEALISVATASVGDYLIITSTSTGVIRFPMGATHFVVGASSPTQLSANDSLSFVFDGNYWVMISSSVNN